MVVNQGWSEPYITLRDDDTKHILMASVLEVVYKETGIL